MNSRKHRPTLLQAFFFPYEYSGWVLCKECSMEHCEIIKNNFIVTNDWKYSWTILRLDEKYFSKIFSKYLVIIMYFDAVAVCSICCEESVVVERPDT